MKLHIHLSKIIKTSKQIQIYDSLGNNCEWILFTKGLAHSYEMFKSFNDCLKTSAASLKDHFSS